MALGWVPDVEYADLWAAIDRHYIADEGLRFHYLPGGPNAPAPVLEISAREATFGDSDWLPFVDAVTQGNDFVILASLFPYSARWPYLAPSGARAHGCRSAWQALFGSGPDGARHAAGAVRHPPASAGLHRGAGGFFLLSRCSKAPGTPTSASSPTSRKRW